MKYLALIFALLATPAWAKLPEPFEGKIVRTSDGDTFYVHRSDGDVKIRLHYVDAPEVAHNKHEVDQLGGRDALKYVTDNWQGKQVTVTPKGESYGRIVADVADKDTGKSLALDLVRLGLAWVDERYGKAADLIAAEKNAKDKKLGLWSQPNPIAPWLWRKQTHSPATKGIFHGNHRRRLAG